MQKKIVQVIKACVARREHVERTLVELLEEVCVSCNSAGELFAESLEVT